MKKKTNTNSVHDIFIPVDNNEWILRAYNVLSTVLYVLHELFHVIISTTPCCKYHTSTFPTTYILFSFVYFILFYCLLLFKYSCLHSPHHHQPQPSPPPSLVPPSTALVFSMCSLQLFLKTLPPFLLSFFIDSFTTTLPPYLCFIFYFTHKR